MSARSSQLLAAGLLLVAVGITLWLLAPSTLALHAFWTQTSSGSHGYLLLLFVAWLLVEAVRDGNARIATALISWLFVAGIAGAALVWGMADLSDRASVRELAFLAILGGLVLVVFRGRSVGALSLPIGLLLFAAPVWWPLVPTLQSMTATAVDIVVHLLDVRAFVDGNRIITAHGEMEVAEGCAGLHQFVIGCALLWIYLHWFVAGWRARGVVLAAGVVVVLVANWIRVSGLVLVGVYSEMQHALITDSHYVYGWLVFGAVCTAFAAVAWLLGARPEVAARRPAWVVDVSLGSVAFCLGAALAVLVAALIGVRALS